MGEKFTLPTTEHPVTPSEPARPYAPNGESIGARFHSIPEPANEKMYDKRKKLATTKKESPIEKPEPILSRYAEIALAPDGGIEKAIETGKQDAIEKWLIKNNFLKRIDGLTTLLDKNVLAKMTGSRKEDNPNYYAPRWHTPEDLLEKFNLPREYSLLAEDFFKYFLHTEVNLKNSGPETLPITSLPSSFTEITNGEYPTCHFKPWEIAQVKVNLWDKPITLEDKTETNISELHIAFVLHELQLKNTRPGYFLITDPKTQERREVATETLTQKYLPNYGDRDAVNIRIQTANFVQHYLKNLTHFNVLNPNNFRKMSNDFETSLTAPSDRQLSSRTSDVSLQTPGGKSLKYYIGREKIVGTEIPLNRENMVIRYLDNHTIGIVRIDKDFEEILCTFPLMTHEEIAERRQQTKERLLSTNKDVSEKKLAGHTIVGGREMKDRIQPYKVSDYLPAFPDENPKDYADRIARLSDARLVSQSTREFFQKVNIGIHQLPWAEQLTASSILLDPRFKKESIATFCKQYGVDGLRTFIASTFGTNINKDILTLGEKSPELAQITFKKFGNILAAIDTAKELVHSVAQKSPEASIKETNKIISNIESHLLTRAKLLLEEISALVNQSKKLSPSTINQISQKLEDVRADIIFFTSTFKSLREGGHEIKLLDFAGSEFPTVNGGELPPTEAAHLYSLYTDSMQEYPDETRNRLLSELNTHLHDGKSTFSLLRYKEEIAGFLCFTETKPGQKYVSAVTLDPRFQKAFIGETMIDEAFAREAENNILGADCVAQKSVSSRYIENGFIGVHSWDDKGDLILDIVRDDTRNDKYFSTKSLTQEEIIRLAPLGSIGTSRIETMSDPKEHTFTLVNEGFVLTRYFKDTKTKKWYIVYEPRPAQAHETKATPKEEEAVV